MSFVETFVAAYGAVHTKIREAIADLDTATLNAAPAPDTNSIATIVTHLLGSEAEVLRVVRGLPTDRDRASEFAAGAQSAQELVARIDAAEALLSELGPAITEDDLVAVRERPSAVRSLGARAGSYWLLNSYGHAREHLGHIELTIQLARARRDAGL